MHYPISPSQRFSCLADALSSELGLRSDVSKETVWISVPVMIRDSIMAERAPKIASGRCIRSRFDAVYPRQTPSGGQLNDFSSKKVSKTEIRLMNFHAQLAMSPRLLLVLSLLLSGCGGGDTVDREDPLEPSVVFSEPDPLLGGGTAKATLEVVNNSSKTITGIVAVFSFPADVQIEGGSVGGTCNLVSSGNTSSEGYQVTFYNLPAGQKCGVFMDILSTAGSGVKVFSVSPGDVTGDGVSPNEKLYSWEWTAP